MKVTRKKIDWLHENAANIYPYGSMVYGTYEEGKSDKDFIVIVPTYLQHLDKQQWECDDEQYSIYSVNTWREKLNRHDIDALECQFLPNWLVIKQLVCFDFTLKTALIRQSVSGTASNSWVKCKKKLTIQKDFAPRVGKKSLWHALRILDFGTQLMIHKRIINYGSCNSCYDEIVNCPVDNWGYYKEFYQPIYNSMKSQFKEAHRMNADTAEELL
ncbi:MAG: nucleotidyltransferase domain-containing protein [Bacteroidaceae bacterium]|nr:nucleotidyltransferase domain-containing protein [Bacteroidaceae bacterium]